MKKTVTKSLKPAGRSVVTQHELAKILKVSYVTINRALNGKGKVSNSVRQNILEAAEKYGYSKNMLASGLVRKQMPIIGLILCGTQSSFFGQVAGSVQAQSRELGYYTLLADSGNDINAENSALASLHDIRAAGVIIQATHGRKNHDIFDTFQKNNIPILTINNREESISKNFLGTNDASGATKAIRYLQKLGHKRIAYLGSTSTESTAIDRMSGYSAAMSEAGLTIQPGWKLTCPHDSANIVEDGHHAIDLMLSLKERPTAIFAFNDAMAIIAIQRLLANGLRVPHDISVIGFANMPECIYSPVPLTTIDQHAEEIGRNAVSLLVDLIEGRQTSPCEKIIDCTLVERESCAQPAHE